MMTVSINKYVLYTLYEPTSIDMYYSFPKELIVYWARDVYEFDESQKTGTVELVINSTFEVAYLSIQGFPRQIPDGDPNRFPSFVVPGPSFPGEVKQPSLCTHIRHLISISSFHVHTFDYIAIPNSLYLGFAFDATIERVFVRVPSLLFGDRIFGNAQVTRKILRIDCTREPKLICRLHLSMQSLVAVML